nr:response regulator transcription factor [uncultured Carboxylicivirga sp.]
MLKRIIIIEDNESLRKGYEFLINSGNYSYKVVETYECAEDFFKDELWRNCDIVLMDIDLPGENGIESTRKLKRINNKVEVLMLTVWQEPEMVFRALENGASGYILKGASSVEIMNAIEELCQGGAPMSPAIARLILQKFHKNLSSPFSDIETEIVKKLAEGKGYKSIANDLDMNSVNNVKYYIKKIYEILQVHNREEAVKIARDNKWI